MKNLITKSPSDTEKVARLVLEKTKTLPVEGALVICLTGDLGAGKTTLTQFLASDLGIKDKVKSPTFIIMESYPINFGRFHKFIHIDAYRLNKPEELANLGFMDLLKDQENLIVIEWPERVTSLIPENAFRVFLKHLDEKTREIIF